MRLVSLLPLFWCWILPANADVGLLMLETTGSGAARYTAAGHTAVYLSGICPESPVRLRLCSAREDGSVISNYTDFGEAQGFEWNVSPFNIFLYGVEDANDRTLYGDARLLRLLQERYREKYLRKVCSGADCEAFPGKWRDMVGATFERDIYAFRVKTTREQDEALVSEFNALPNVNRYNGLSNNCADFARRVLNRYFPGSARADRINDFGMTSPKAVAKSFAHYGRKHPELLYSAERYTQLPGPIRRSMDNREGTEVGFHAKKWSIPLLITPGHLLIYFAATYYLTGWFNPEHEYQLHGGRLDSGVSRREESEAWREYEARFPSVLARAYRDGVFTCKKDVDGYFQRLEREGRIELDANGAPMLTKGTAHVWLTRGKLLRRDSDRLLAERLMLARVNAELKSAHKNRESLGEFRADWEILDELGRVREAQMMGIHSGL